MTRNSLHQGNEDDPDLSQLLSGTPTQRVADLLSRLGFSDANSIELHIVLPNLAKGSVALRSILQDVPGPINALTDELVDLLERFPVPDLAAVSRGIRSRFASDPNPLRGRYQDFPLCAVVSIPPDQLAEGSTEQFQAVLGLLLLARLQPQAPPLPTDHEQDVATGVRKCFTNPEWKRSRGLLQPVNGDFLLGLRNWQTKPAAAFLPQVQRDFFAALGNLLCSRHFRSPGQRYHPDLEDEPDDTNAPGSHLEIARIRVGTTAEGATEEPEPDDVPSTLLQIDPTKRKPGESDLTERLRLTGAAHRFIRDNQFLPYRWHSLTPEEARETVRLAIQMFRDRETSRMAIVGMSVHITGQHPHDLPEFIVASSLRDEIEQVSWSDNHLDLAGGHWWHMKPSLPNPFHPSHEQRRFLAPHSRWIALVLPEEYRAALVACHPAGRDQSLGQTLGLGPAETAKALADFCVEVRKRSPWVRAFPARLRSSAFDWWVSRTSDDTAASLASEVTEYSPTAPLYYYSAKAEDLQRLHLERLAELGWTLATHDISQSAQFGSHLVDADRKLTHLERMC